MNFKKLENNLLDMIQEQQVKIGYMSGVTRFYYPLQSLNRLLGTELTKEEMQHALEEFSDHACDRLGKVKASSKNERFCITLPPQASDYVHENRKPSEFLVRFINTVARHGCTLDEVMDVPDRILVMYEGEIVGELDPKATTQEELGLYMAGAKRDEVKA